MLVCKLKGALLTGRPDRCIILRAIVLRKFFGEEISILIMHYYYKGYI